MDDLDERAPAVSHAQLIRLSLEALAARSIKLLTLVMAFLLSGACVWRPHWIALSATALFVGLVSPLWWRKERRDA